MTLDNPKKASDARHMAHALRLGARGLGRVAPWPSVGCVIVKDGRVVGRGVSDRSTMRHAEIVALDQAGEAARGATVYVTLEPCCHHGSTPPCSDALIAAGVARVVAATGDPNPLVAGKGLKALKNAGIQVEIGLSESLAREQNSGFLAVQEKGRPHITLKLAMTVDGRIATGSGESRWITGSEARRIVHAMRLSHDAVMVGAGTARADDPDLTAREIGATHQPIRIVASRRINLPWPMRLIETLDDAPVWIVHGEGDEEPEAAARWSQAGAKLIGIPVADAQIDVGALVQALASERLTRVLVEGGGSFAASLLSAGVVDELVVFSAGMMLGAEGQPGIGALGISHLADAPRFRLIECRNVGKDILHRWRRD